MWTDRITLRVSETQVFNGSCQLNRWTILTDEEVMVPTEN
jgi:hypothetical protein